MTDRVIGPVNECKGELPTKWLFDKVFVDDHFRSMWFCLLCRLLHSALQFRAGHRLDILIRVKFLLIRTAKLIATLQMTGHALLSTNFNTLLSHLQS